MRIYILSGFIGCGKDTVANFIKEKYENVSTTGSRSDFIDRILEKGITISCFEGETHMASTETWLKYGEAIDGGGAVPALGETTTTTTVA